MRRDYSKAVAGESTPAVGRPVEVLRLEPRLVYHSQLHNQIVLILNFVGSEAGHRVDRRDELAAKEMHDAMLTATSRSIPGTLRQELLIAGQHRLVTDEPEHLGGENAGPAPQELFPAAIASCISTTMLMYGRTKGWDLGRSSSTSPTTTGRRHAASRSRSTWGAT